MLDRKFGDGAAIIPRHHRNDQFSITSVSGSHLLPSEFDMLVNVVFGWPPRALTAAMMATEMPAAISPYSMAVAAFSSRAKYLIRDIDTSTPRYRLQSNLQV
jgi:hypothetical protein